MERGLKTGFRALAEDNANAARDAFQEVLTIEPGHPEARAGLRAAENTSRSRSVAVRQSGFVAGGHDLPTSQPIDHDTLRLEV